MTKPTEAQKEISGPVLDPESPAPASDRALAVLELLAEYPGGMSVAEIVRHLQVSQNSISRIMMTLEKREYVFRRASDRRFLLTGKLMRLAQPKVGGKILLEEALPVMRKLRDSILESVALLAPCGPECVLLAQLPALHAMKITWDIGVRTAMYYSAPGKVFLAFADEAEGMRLLDQQELLAATPQTITDRNQMLAELGEVLRQGYATDRGEFFEGIHCVAAPVRGFDDEVVAAITITGPAHRLPESDFPRLAELTIQAAGDLTERFRTP